MSYSPEKRGDNIIAVVGPSGSGKSSFIKCATGLETVEIGDSSLEPCTTDVQVFICPNPCDAECNIVFIDTPGFDNTDKGVSGILEELADWLKERYGESAVLTGLLFFHPMTGNRVVGDNPILHLSNIRKLCGIDALRAAMIITTMWDTSEADSNDETELREGYWKPMVRAGSRFLRFDNTRESACMVVGHLVSSDPRYKECFPKQSLAQARRAVPVQVKDPSDERVIIAVMGPTGSGKSTFIEKITGGKVDAGCSPQSSKTDIGDARIKSLGRSDCDVVFVDTPGFDDTDKSDTEILAMISGWLKKTYEYKTTLTGILYLHRISDNRMTGTPLKNLRMFTELCGKNALQNIVLTTTMWDEVEEEKGEEREKELRSEYWKPMIDQGATTARYRGTAESAWEIVDHFVDAANRRRAVQLQEEIADMKEPLFKTSKGQELYRNLQLLLSEVQETLKKQRAETKRRADDNLLKLLKREYEAFQKELAAIIEEIRALKCPVGKHLVRLI